MSDEAKETKEAAPAAEEKKKKGGKLPMIVALVLFLAGGGFFVMKGKGNAAPKKPEAPALGVTEPIKEMLVNLSGGNSYLKIEVALQMVKDFKKEELEKNKEAITDSILLCLKSKKLSDIQTMDQLRDLKKEIAEGVNKILEAGKKPEGEATDKSKDSESKDDKPKAPDDYDSPTGPVLKRSRCVFNSCCKTLTDSSRT